MKNSWLAHHGIKGQKWGVRRFEDKNGRLTAAGKERYGRTGKRSEADEAGEKQKFWTDERKELAKKIAIGSAVVAGVALATYGTYRLYEDGKLNLVIDKFKQMGENKVKDLAGDINYEAVNKVAIGDKNFKKVTETVQEGLNKANPLRGKTEGKNNCVPSQLAGFMRDEFGVDAVAKGTGGEAQSLFDVTKEVFHINENDTKRLINPTNSMSISSSEKARETLVKRFGTDAKGVISFTFKKNSPFNGQTNETPEGDDDIRVGHAIYFAIKNGIVEFRDYKIGRGDSFVSTYFDEIDVERSCTLTRIDGLEPDLDILEQFVEIRK